MKRRRSRPFPRTYTAFNVDENTATSRIIKTYRATGVGEGSVLTWTLEGADRADFTIRRNAQGHGELRFANAPNYERAADAGANNVYDVTVKVADNQGGLSDTLMVRVTVDDVNEAPVVTGEAAPSFQENKDTAVASYTAADPKRDTLTWSVSGSDFWISDRGQLYFRTPPSAESGTTSYTVTITATDDDTTPLSTTPLSGSLAVTVTVTDVEENGTIAISPLLGWEGTSFTADLTDGDGGISGESWQWARSSNRSSWTDIPNASSASYTATSADVGNYLRASVTYSDRRSSNKTAEAVLAGRIGDVNDRQATNNAPEFTDTPPVTRAIGQGTAAGRSIGAPVRATDPDSDAVLTYSLSGAAADTFDIDPATGQLRTKAVLNYDPQGQNAYEVTVQVHDGFNPVYSPTPSGDASIAVTITVTAGAAVEAPQFVDGFRTSRPLAENARPGDAVGDPVGATHPQDSAITYSLSGTDAARFTVDEETGQIRLGQAVTLALGQTYTVNLTATDSSGTGAIIIVVIEVAEGVGDPYDLNRNASIEKDEVLAAVFDYFAGLIEKDEVLMLVTRYFAG